MAPAWIEQAVSQVRLINGSPWWSICRNLPPEVQGSQEVDLFADQGMGEYYGGFPYVTDISLKTRLEKECFQTWLHSGNKNTFSMSRMAGKKRLL